MKRLHGDKSPAWRGGHGTINALGYVVHTVQKKVILQHRLVMEAHIGRPLAQGEVVHHINGDRSDNRPENLVLCRTQAAHVHEHHKRGSIRTTCRICGEPEQAKQLCNRHYKQAKRAQRRGILSKT